MSLGIWPPTDLASVEANVGKGPWRPQPNFLHPRHKAGGIEGLTESQQPPVASNENDTES
jgi:hypothetical protein